MRLTLYLTHEEMVACQKRTSGAGKPWDMEIEITQGVKATFAMHSMHAVRLYPEMMDVAEAIISGCRPWRVTFDVSQLLCNAFMNGTPIRDNFR